jgi:dTDP-4-dehydrorhamnose reductase
MPTIGVVGANGQVGTEVCLFLSRMEQVRVIPITRTELGAAFLTRCGLECRTGSISDAEQARQLLLDCDLVADFTLPRGTASQIRAASNGIITNLMTCAPPSAHAVYVSTIMAFGMGPRDRSFHEYALARTVYGATKRYAERLFFRLGKRTKRKAYVLRMGQVHGHLQAVSQNILRSARDETVYVPKGPSWTAFAFTVAEALVNIALGKEEPGLYTLVSVPEWSWKDLHAFYCEKLGFTPEIIEVPLEQGNVNPLRTLKTWVNRLALGPTMAVVTRNREFISGNGMYAFPQLEHRARAIYLQRRAAVEIGQYRYDAQCRPYDRLFQGAAPGKRLDSLSDSRETMHELSSKVWATIEQVVRTDLY